MTEDIFILDCHTEIFVWVGQQVDPKKKPQVLTIGEVLFFSFYYINVPKLQKCSYGSSASNRNSLSTISF